MVSVCPQFFIHYFDRRGPPPRPVRWIMNYDPIHLLEMDEISWWFAASFWDCWMCFSLSL